ncbi:MAG: hypothetical protein L0H84_07655 [Pseudonocardia sp.]|nr:hypothetical protein [Pseudonocardia sp.]
MTAHTYAPPRTSTTRAVPDEVAGYLDGTNLLAKTQAVRLSTVAEAGWPSAALLSAGDMLVVPPDRIRFLLFPESTTTANLARDDRLTLALALDGGMCELRLHARRLPDPAGVPLALFEAVVETTRVHVAPYAAVTGGITFALHDPAAVFPRWERQIAALRAAG